MNTRPKIPWTCRLFGHAWIFPRPGVTPVRGLDSGDMICTSCGFTKWSGE